MHFQNGVNMKNKIVSFFKSQTVLSIAIVLACITMIIVPPNRDYIGYIDYGTLILLFSLMGAVAGLNKCGIFRLLSDFIIKKCKSIRMIVFLLVNICFITSMFITNDVALLTFVPVSVMIFEGIGMKEKFPLIFTIVLETAAANLGSMLLPTGNPQNIYLCSYCDIIPSVLIDTLLPFGIFSYIILSLSVLVIPKYEIKNIINEYTKNNNFSVITVITCVIIFIVSLLTVSGVINEYICLAAAIVLLLISGKDLFTKIDYSLILTFVFFFIFVGNISTIDTVKNLISEIISGREILTAVLSSQIFSNVPAAILLSGFTDNAHALLIGTNIGGLGTPIASLASLIAFRLYMAGRNSSARTFMVIFLIYNILFLIILYVFCCIIL